GGLETWCTFAFKLRDFAQLSQALEARADSTSGSDAADLLVEASELARAAGNDVRSTTLLRKARGVDPGSSTARNALLALSTIPSRERIELLQEEARHTAPERAAALQAERAMLLEEEGRVDEAVYACTQALTLAGLDLAVLRRLVRLQLRRGDHAAALAALVHGAETVPEGHPRAEAYGRAAEAAEWRVGDPLRAIDLYKAATQQHPQAAFAWAQLARLLAWTERPVEAAEACERLAAVAQPLSERNEARRWAASLYAHRAAEPEKAASLLRALLAEAPGDLEAAAELLAFRCSFADGDTRAALALEQAQIFVEQGRMQEAAAAYRHALASDPASLVALKGERHIAGFLGDEAEVARLLAREGSVASNAGAMV